MHKLVKFSTLVGAALALVIAPAVGAQANSNTDSTCKSIWQTGGSTWGRGCWYDGLVAADDTLSDGHSVHIEEYYSGAWHTVSGTTSSGSSSPLEYERSGTDSTRVVRSDGRYFTLKHDDGM